MTVSPPHIVSEEEALETDAQYYVDQYGIDTEEAVRRIQAESRPDVGELIAAAELAYGENFAGAWIEHSPIYQLVLSVTEGTEQILPIPDGLPMPVDFRNDAAYSLDELLRFASDAARDVAALIGESVGSYVDVTTNRAVVNVFDELRAEHGAELETLLASRPVEIRWISGAGPQ